jgi:hypothetical protein
MLACLEESLGEWERGSILVWFGWVRVRRRWALLAVALIGIYFLRRIPRGQSVAPGDANSLEGVFDEK